MATAKGTDSVLVKKPHTRESFTEEQLREFAKCADPLGHWAWLLGA